MQGLTCENLGPYGRGNFPGQHDVFAFWEKGATMGENVHILFRMSNYRCIKNGESKNKAKRVANLRSGHVLERMSTYENSRKLTKMVVVIFRIMWFKRGETMGVLYKSNVKNERKNNKTNKDVK